MVPGEGRTRKLNSELANGRLVTGHHLGREELWPSEGWSPGC